MRAHFGLPSVESEEMEAKRPITVHFEIPYFTVSGIQVGPFSKNLAQSFFSSTFLFFFPLSTMCCLTFTHGRTAE